MMDDLKCSDPTRLMMLQLYNTPDRIERIEQFRVWFEVRTHSNKAEPILLFTDPVIIEDGDVDIFYNYLVEQIHDGREDLNQSLVEKRLTSFLANMLFECQAFFDGEVNDFVDKGLYAPYTEETNKLSAFRVD
jgi:hypothetical protein